HRLRQEFYGDKPNQKLFEKRVLTEAVHEIGHLLNLKHCSNPNCVMFFSNSILDTDRKGFLFCNGCRSKFKILK
ncbi:matrixin family metalloprotease, partial [Candidatus Kryptobacter tengchongensis]